LQAVQISPHFFRGAKIACARRKTKQKQSIYDFFAYFFTLNMAKLVCMKKNATTCFFLDVVVCLLFLCLGLSLRAWGTPAVRHIGDDGTTFATDYYSSGL